MKEFCHKRASSPKEEGKEEHTPEPPERDYHSLSSDNSLSSYRKKQRNDDNLQGEFRKIRSETYEGEMNTEENSEEWLQHLTEMEILSQILRWWLTFR